MAENIDSESQKESAVVIDTTVPENASTDTAQGQLQKNVSPTASPLPSQAQREDSFITETQKQKYKSEKDAMQDILSDNVKLDKKVKRLTDQVLELEDRNMDLEEQLGKTTTQNTGLIERVQKLEQNEATKLANGSHDDQLKNLQLRLKRLTLDERQKDLRLDDLQLQLNETKSYIKRLEAHIGDEQTKVIRAEHKRLKKDEDYYKTKEKTNAVIHEKKVQQKSTVCVII